MKHFFNFIFLISFSISLFSQNKIERLEPANWWIGMEHQNIQLLVYGENIADLDPKIESTDLTIRQVTKVQNPNYLFLDILINTNANAGTINIDFYQNKIKITSHPFQLLDRKRGADEIVGFDSRDAIYLITPDRFANGNPSNDNIEGMKQKANRSDKGGRHGGDIQGMKNSLDYIKDLGFTSIWLNPVLENDMEVYSYHGYSTTDFYKVDPRFGTNESYQDFAETARAKGLKLIMDMIVNHCGSFHWWMDDLPSDDWINQWDEMTFTNHRKTVLQDPYVSDFDKKQFTDGWFVETMPDLNPRNPLFAKYLIQNSIWWVEYLGLSGIRMDTYPYPDMDFMTDWTKAMMKEYPYLNIVGEEWYEHPTIVSYWQKGKNNPNGYTSELKSVMDFPIQMSMSKALNEKENWNSGWIRVYEMLALDYLYPDPMNLVIFPDNHDMKRIFAQMNDDYNKYQQAMIFVATMRGIPQYYYGTEILMSGSGDHGIIRSDFPGGWKSDEVNAFTGKGLTVQQKKAKDFTTKLLHWRQSATAIHNGKLMHFIPKDGIYVYFRYNDDQKVMIIFNKNQNETTIDLSRYAEMLKGKTIGTDVLDGKVFSLDNKIQVAKNGATILDLK
ncbi:glycoside hydrolase family 13 protein [Saprospiraceae bacterium]|jgi:glycosidase|nr:glycoside hydrolase family 13 protein [Saprospiraceae bacterium]